jgi:hypothetical protein
VEKLDESGSEELYEHKSAERCLARLQPPESSITVFDRGDGTRHKPYLIVRMMPAVYLREDLPPDVPEHTLLGIARRRSMEENKRVCVVLSPTNCIYVELDGTAHRRSTPPWGGLRLQRA